MTESGTAVVVVGSANIDQIFRVTTIPTAGETVLSHGFSTALGGKGQNQAVASARAGAATSFLAAVGDDSFGSQIRQGLAADSVDISRLRTVSAPTGTAMIAVDDSAENMIIVEPGANALLTGLSLADRAVIGAARVVVLQLEIPLDTVIEAADAAHAATTTVVLNAAPIRDLPDALLGTVDILVVNEHELAVLTAARPGTELTDLVPVLVITLGSRGAVLRRRGLADLSFTAPKVTAVDTTGAGDTFCGALAASLAEGTELELAVRFAVVAGSLSVQRVGAVPAIPHREEILAQLPKL